MEIGNPYVETYVVYETKALVSELCKQFYGLGWVLGTGGSVSIKVHDDKLSKSDQLIVMPPSGVQKERMVPEDMYVLSSNGVVLSTPLSKPYPYKYPNCSECTPLFLQAYKIRNAGAVIHSHGIESCLVTMIRPLMKEFRIRNMEMIKGIEGHGYHDELVIPIIENTAKEGDLIDYFTEAIRSYPKSTAVLVRNHGVYIWGETWISAKTQAECYHYLFDAAGKLHQMGLDWSTLNHDPICNANTVCGSSGNLQRSVETRFNCSIDTIAPPQCCILFGVEEWITHISLVSADDVSKYIDAKLVKLSAGTLFDDVPKALKRWHDSGFKVYTLFNCSTSVQRHLFGYSNYGDLTKYMSFYFGRNNVSFTELFKNERKTYMEILQTIGVKRAADMIYVTGSLSEALAARDAGMEAILNIRPGNENLTQQQRQGFRIVESLLELC